MNKIALFFDRPYIEAHFCYKELLIQLINNNFCLILFIPQNADIGNLSKSKDIQIIRFKKNKFGSLLFFLRFILNTLNCKFVIANPSWPLFWSCKLNIMGRLKIICLSDEVYGNNPDEFNLEQKQFPFQLAKKWKNREKWAHQNSILTIALGEERYKLVKEMNSLPVSLPYIVIPNSPSIKTSLLESERYQDYYRKRFSFNKTDIIILHSGSLLWRLLEELNEIELKSSSIKIVLQARRDYEIVFKNSNIFQNEEFLSYENIVEATKSAQIGLMLYDENNVEERRNGPTAGKLGLYVGAGLPIISYNLSSMKWLEDKHIGICINTLADLEHAVLTIMNDYSNYSNNVKKYFKETLAYDINFQKLLPYISSL
jgi:hypothetical protein